METQGVIKIYIFYFQKKNRKQFDFTKTKREPKCKEIVAILLFV